MNLDSTALTLRNAGIAGLFLLGVAVTSKSANPPNNSCSGLHAGIAVQVVTRKPPYTEPSFAMVSFVLLNDGGSSASSSPESWTLVVDGKELDDSGMIFGNGPMPVRGYGTLGPGESYSFGKGLDLNHYFPKPGDYSVGWKGKQFQSPTIRVTVAKSDY